MLPENEQEIVVTKYKGAEAANGTGTGMNLVNQNHFLMMLLRVHCEEKQMRHVHDTAENRYESSSVIIVIDEGAPRVNSMRKAWQVLILPGSIPAFLSQARCRLSNVSSFPPKVTSSSRR
jgi:hypothetical protein